MTDNRAWVIVAPGEGAALELGLARPTIKIGPPLSTQIGLLASELPPGGGLRVPHWHEALDEWFYVPEGEIDYPLETQWRRAPAGTTVFIPAGTIHAFRNDSGSPARHLAIGPPGVVELITELARHPRDPWEQVHACHRSHYAHDRPGRLGADHAAAGGPATAPGAAGATR